MAFLFVIAAKIQCISISRVTYSQIVCFIEKKNFFFCMCNCKKYNCEKKKFNYFNILQFSFVPATSEKIFPYDTF